MKLLIIEDEKHLADSLKLLLSSDGFEADTAYDGVTGLDYALTGTYDLLILDVMLPGMNGYQVAEQIRRRHNSLPILMLTARSDLLDRVEGLNAGADYYLTKPFDNRELLACVHALLRRSGGLTNQLSFGDITLDLSSGILACQDQSVRLSARELEVLQILMQEPERNTSKESLLTRVWGYDSDAVDNTVEVYIGFLRKKLTGISSRVKIVAVRRLGYHLETEESR